MRPFTLCLLLVLAASRIAHAQDADPTQQNLIERGRYLAIAADCQACHGGTSPAGSFAGGKAIETPVGKIIASNITPSQDQGIGRYSEAQFAAAVRQGKRADGANLFPAMPYPAYRGISDADIHALYVYFMQGVAPVNQGVTATHLDFPFGWRPLMSVWNALFISSAPPASEASELLRRGRYLVDSLGHCGTCHTPRNAMMGEVAAAYLGGANVAGWYAPNITSDPVSGIGSWSEDELVHYLRTGHANGKGQAAGGMAEAVSNSLRLLDDGDLQAMAAYLRTVPPIRDPQQLVQRSGFAGKADPPSALEPLLNRQASTLADSDELEGSRLYNAACASCHQIDGRGIEGQFYPSLSHNSVTGDRQASSLIMAILRGVERQTPTYDVLMPAFADQLNDGQVAAVSNYVLQQFGNPDVQVSAEQVSQARSGGPIPLLLSVAPYLLMLAVALLLLCCAVLWRMVRRSRGD